MIIILAAGNGARFRAAGISTPKPLMEYKGTPLIRHALAIAGNVDTIVVGTREVVNYLDGCVKTVPVEVTQRGPAMSALLAGGLIPRDEAVVIMDCDTIIDPKDFYRLWAKVDCSTEEGYIMVTAPPGGEFKYCGVHVKDGHISRITEKEGGDFVGVGVYGFSTWRHFTEVAARASLEVPGEVFVSHCLDRMKRVFPVFVNAASWISVGNPEDLATANG